jgi:signal transduction histidine kinase
MPNKNNVNHKNMDVMWKDLKGFAKKNNLSEDDINIFKMLNLSFPASYNNEIDFYTNQKEWSSHDTYVQCYLMKKKITKDPNCYRNTGRSAATYKSWGEWKTTAKSLNGPAAAINLLPDIVPNWNVIKIFEIIEPAKYRIRSQKIESIIKYTFCPDIEPTDDYCSDPHILGLIEAIPTNFPPSLFKFWDRLPLGIAEQKVVQYDPIKLFNSRFFEEFNLNPFWDDNFLYVTNPNDNEIINIGEKVILLPSKLNEVEHFLGKYKKINDKITENDNIGTIITKNLSYNNENICKEGIRMGAPSFIINYSSEDMKISKSLWYIRSIFGNMELIEELVEQNKEQKQIIEELDDRVDEQTKELKETQQQLLHERTMAATGTLAAGVAHNFKQYLEAIHKFTEQLIIDGKSNFYDIKNFERFNIEKDDQENLLNFIKSKYFSEDKIPFINGSMAYKNSRILMKHSKEYDIEINKKQAIDLANCAINNQDLDTLTEYIKKYDKKDIIELLNYGQRLGSQSQGITDTIAKAQKVIKNIMTFTDMAKRTDKEIYITQTIDNLLDNYKDELNKVKITLTKSYEDESQKVNIDPRIITNVIETLYSNSIYSLREKKENKKIFINSYKESDNNIIEFVDNGPGISNENQEKIFNPFFTTKPGSEGTGMGLFYAYSLINSYGNLTVESNDEKTTFKIRLKNNKL